MRERDKKHTWLNCKKTFKANYEAYIAQLPKLKLFHDNRLENKTVTANMERDFFL